MVQKFYKWSLFLCVFFIPLAAQAAVEWDITHTIDLAAEPLDAVISPNGQQVYVLTRNGEVIIFDANGKQKEVLKVGKDISALAIGPGGDTLMLLSSGKQQAKIVRLSFIFDIPTTGNPFKGNEKAPVTVVVFSDFQ